MEEAKSVGNEQNNDTCRQWVWLQNHPRDRPSTYRRMTNASILLGS